MKYKVLIKPTFNILLGKTWDGRYMSIIYILKIIRNRRYSHIKNLTSLQLFNNSFTAGYFS